MQALRASHNCRLLRKLQVWQAAKSSHADAKELFAVKKGTGVEKASAASLAAARGVLDACTQRVTKLEEEILALRARLAMQVPSLPEPPQAARGKNAQAGHDEKR
jgi:hypothetical protein